MTQPPPRTTRCSVRERRRSASKYRQIGDQRRPRAYAGCWSRGPTPSCGRSGVHAFYELAHQYALLYLSDPAAGQVMDLARAPESSKHDTPGAEADADIRVERVGDLERLSEAKLRERIRNKPAESEVELQFRAGCPRCRATAPRGRSPLPPKIYAEIGRKLSVPTAPTSRDRCRLAALKPRRLSSRLR